MTLEKLSISTALPTSTAWYLAELGEALGKQALFTRQSPQRLRVLREHALIQSAVSSNRIEGVEVDQGRVRTLVFGRPSLKDRSEEELSGYRDALNLIHVQGAELAVTQATIRRLHRMSRGEVWDAGRYRTRDTDIIETRPDGRLRVRFRPVAARQVPPSMRRLVAEWSAAVRERTVHPFVALAAANLDFLCVHPFRDGNGRASRLLLLLTTYHAGMEVGRYISLERLIEQNKERYYETLEHCSAGWHQGKHDPWPYINYILYVLKLAYREFEERVGETADPRGAKLQTVREAVARQAAPFTVSEIERACPGVSRDWIRSVLRQMRDHGEVLHAGLGRGRQWRFNSKRGSNSRKG